MMTDPKKDKLVPIAEIIRRRRRKRSHSQSLDDRGGADFQNQDIDEEIKRLEAELADIRSSDSDEDDDYSSDADSDLIHHDEKSSCTSDVSALEDIQASRSGVLILSECAKDKIAPLPEDKLPFCKSKKLKVDSDDNPTVKSNKAGVVNDGLRKAAEEVLSGYVARSSERIPFYCRVCAKTMENENEFKAHKLTEFHKVAVQLEKKKTYCKLCRKQLTSIVQMGEHLKSKPHKERLEFVKTQGKNPRGRIHVHRQSGAANGGHSGGERKADSRQWC